MPIERLQCHPGKIGGHVFWRLQFCFQSVTDYLQPVTELGAPGRRSSRDDTATSLYIVAHFSQKIGSGDGVSCGRISTRSVESGSARVRDYPLCM